ncbi:MAG: DUF3164 family protein [Deltaproteobacteria bacterium]|nr:DUF3164 family protein [Deltaproteobacteria bacterium]
MNFYSHAPNTGIQYHPTGKEAKEACEKAIRTLQRAGAVSADIFETITWGEVTERVVPTGADSYSLKRQERLSYEALHPQVIDGRMRDDNDSLVLVERIRETDLLYHDMVLSIAVIWKSLSGKIQRFKQYNFEDVAAVLGLLFEKYGVERGGRDGNMQFFTFDRKFKLSIAIQKKLDFGPELQAAERKLNQALEEMTSTESDSAADLKTIVTGAFTLVDGKLRVSEVLRLRSYKISNSTWNEAMQIVDAAIVVISSKKQIRLYERNEQGEYIAIPLDIAAL